MKVNKLIDFLRFCGDPESVCTGCDRYDEMGIDGGTNACVCDLMQKAASALESQQKRITELEAERDTAVKNSYSVQQIEAIQDEAYDLGADSVLHNHFGLTWDDAAKLRQQIAAIQKQQRWIPVTERLPENNVRVLVFLAARTSTYTRVDTDRMLNGKWVRWDDKYVTHWMPLPEPPKEVD